jgi:hypothetical protein
MVGRPSPRKPVLTFVKPTQESNEIVGKADRFQETFDLRRAPNRLFSSVVSRGAPPRKRMSFRYAECVSKNG